MQSGKLRHLVTIQQNTPTTAADGSLVDGWATFGSAHDLPAEIRTEGGREFWRQRQMNSELTHEVTIRYYAGIRANMQVVFGSRTFQIATVIQDEARKTFTRLICKELNA
jgi:SPP1 family predicted phage head-tail adaptor